MKKILTLTVLSALALAGCSTNNSETTDSNTTSTPSSTASASPRPSSAAPTKTTSPSPTASESTATGPLAYAPSDFPTVQPTQDAAPAVVPTSAPAAAPTVQDYLATGGTCIADVWNSSLPYNDSLAAEVHAYCDANDLGDWANGVDPYDYAAYQTQQPVEQPTKEAPQYGYTNNELTREQCESLDTSTAMSGQIQYCFMQYGI